jgi:hypothetical protein
MKLKPVYNPLTGKFDYVNIATVISSIPVINYVSDDATSVKVDVSDEVIISESTSGYDAVTLEIITN